MGQGDHRCRRAWGGARPGVSMLALLAVLLATGSATSGIVAAGSRGAGQVTLSLWPSGQGRIDATPAGGATTRCDFATVLDSGVPCAVPVASGTKVKLVATPEPGAARPDLLTPDPVFAHWSRFDCKGAAPCTFTMGSSNEWVSATFSPLQLEVGIAGDGKVQVEGADGSLADLDCTPLVDPAGNQRRFGDRDCHGAFPADRPVVLVATPATAGDPIRWGQGCAPAGGDPSSSTCTVTMSNIRTFAAVAFGDPTVVFPPDFPFRISATLAVVLGGLGHGKVTGGGSDVNGNAWAIDCGQACSALVGYQTPATLTAAADAGSRFVRWQGVCATGQACTFDAGSIATVEALFTTPAAPFAPRLSSVAARKTQSGRRVLFTVTVDRPAQATVSLSKGGKTVVGLSLRLRLGRNLVRLPVPRTAVRGVYRLSAVVAASGESRTLAGSVKVPR